MGTQINGLYWNGDGTPHSILKRQFISFSYDGKDIEEFGLIVSFEGNGLTKEIYAPFQDIVTEHDEIDGQLFWHSKFKANTLSLTLATDGMTVKQLEDFKYHFCPGLNKELILSEHHNRAILARVASSPKIELIPFKSQEKIIIEGQSYLVTTSLFKGKITLDFIMDNPYWYSKVSHIDLINDENLKIIYEDNVPYLFSLDNCLLSNGDYCENHQIVKEPTQNVSKLYYCGTVFTNPQISFDLTISKDSNYKIFLERNNYNEYPYLAIGNKKIHFDLPSIFTSYNYAIDAINLFNIGSSVLEIRKAIQSSTFDYYTRAYAISIIEVLKQSNYVDNNGKILEGFKEQFLTELQKFPSTDTYHCEINNQDGSVFISCNIVNSQQVITEKAGNMIKSNYLIIEPSKTNYQEISSNVNIQNLKINYKYMYL